MWLQLRNVLLCSPAGRELKLIESIFSALSLKVAAYGGRKPCGSF